MSKRIPPVPYDGRGLGFTLVELLVVIGIISLLISILMPALGRARAAAQRVQCMSNLRQIQMASIMYCQENKGWIIPSLQPAPSAGGMMGFISEAATTNRWGLNGQGYLTRSNTPQVAMCPSNPLVGLWNTPTNYAGNYYTMPNIASPPAKYVNMNQIKESHATVIQFSDGELVPWTLDYPPAAVYMIGAYASSVGYWHGKANPTGEGGDGADGNISCMDGHVEAVRLKDASGPFVQTFDRGNRTIWRPRGL